MSTPAVTQSVAVTQPVVLVAEDSLVIRAVLRQHLESRGYAVVEADDGDAALRVCRDTRPDVVLLDIEMPGLDGHQVLAALKADVELADIPVVFLTGRTSPDDIVEGLRLGAHDYLKKPFEASELIARVSAAVRMKTVQDELRARNAELDLISRTDALTGLANRRQLVERLAEMGSMSRRHDRPLGVLMLDIDHFKRVNDTAGHDAGDAVLREFARRLRQLPRVEDVVGRWGGEEFLVLLPDTGLVGARLFGERVVVAIAAEPFALPDGTQLRVTVSVGCAVDTPDDAEKLVAIADAALYEAKAAGRNRLVCAPGATPVRSLAP
jgi:two-component system cell cycle response regulator